MSPDLRELVAAAGLDATGHRAAVPASEPEYRVDPQGTCEMLAGALRRLHEVPHGTASADTPRADVGDAVDAARSRLDAGVPFLLDDAYAHMEPERLLEVLTDGGTELGEVTQADLVVTHGRPGLDALSCHEGVAIGFADWSGVALADRHRDLAWAASSVAASLGAMLVPVFFEGYGRRPDPRRLDWWALAIQLCGAPTPAVRPMDRDR